MTASIALLKGSKKKADEALAAEAAKAAKAAKAKAPEPAPEPVATPATEETVELTEESVLKMSSAELDALVKEHDVATPPVWAKMKVSDKRQWLIAEITGENTPAAEGEAREEEVEVPFVPATPTEAQVEQAVDDMVEQVKAETKPKKTGKAVGKATKVLTGEVLGADPIADLVHEVENLKEKDAMQMAMSVSDQNEFGFFKLGGILSIIKKNAWYKSQYSNFKVYVEEVHNIKWRNADYYIGIYDHMADSGVPWVKVKDVGWTKLKEIAGIITPENVDEWVESAGSLTTLQLNQKVKSFLSSGTNQKALEDKSFTETTTMTFKVHQDQKANIDMAIEKAMKVGETAVKTVALDYICLEYLGGKPKINLVDLLRNAGLENALKAIEKAFPNVELEAKVSDEPDENSEAA